MRAMLCRFLPPSGGFARCLLALGLLGAVGLRPAHAALPAPDPFALCRTAIRAASLAAGLPPGLLAAVAEVESGRPDPRDPGLDHSELSGATRGLVLRAAGRNLLGLAVLRPPPPRWRPWPWTIDADGVGQFFATEAEAIAAVAALQRAGVHSIDVGCLQVNLAAHPHAFRSLRAAFDPATNARYAAAFLNRLFARAHDWPAAVAAYHSLTPALGRPYRQSVFARWRARPPGAAPRAYADFLPRTARYADFSTR